MLTEMESGNIENEKIIENRQKQSLSHMIWICLRLCHALWAEWGLNLCKISCAPILQSQLLMLSSDISMILRFTYKSWRTSRRTLLHLSLSRAGSASEWSYCFCVMVTNITPVTSPPVKSNVVGSVAISRLSCSTDAHIAFLIMNTCCHRW